MNIEAKPTPSSRPGRPQHDLIELQRLIHEHFTSAEVKQLCFELKLVDYDDLAGETKEAKTRELVKFCHRYGHLQELVERCSQIRPGRGWHEVEVEQIAGALPEEWEESLLRWHRLVQAFNCNRNQRFSAGRTYQGDDIAFAMREMAPLVFGQFEVHRWIKSSNRGKRLAAVKYLDWLQDVAYFGNLAGKLLTEKPFVQLHALIALDGMIEQLSRGRRRRLKIWLRLYTIVHRFYRDEDTAFWQRRILERLR